MWHWTYYARTGIIPLKSFYHITDFNGEDWLMNRIMIVDDEQDFCSLVEELLVSAGYRDVLTCSETDEALTKITEFHPDLLVLDVNMPGMTGDDIAAALRENPRTKDIPIIFLTALVDSSDIGMGDNMIGSQIFISKPVKVNDLLQVVKATLNKK